MRHVLVPRELAPLALVDVSRDAEVESLGGDTMGTSWSVKFVRPHSVAIEQVHTQIRRVLDRVIAQMSTWIADSDISRFNRAAAGTWHTLPAEFFTVLRCGLKLAGQTGGAYDPTAGALVDLWGFGPAGRRAFPSDDEIEAARRNCGWQRVKLDAASSRALQPGGVRLDLSSIAKGYAVDLVAEGLALLGIRHSLVEIGGELRGQGIKPDGSPWWVALDGGDETLIALHSLAVATSGDSQRSFERDGRRLSHSIDPRTGYPVPEELAAVTVLHSRCMEADALATALLCLGPDKGFEFACGAGLAARFVLRGAPQRVTPAFSAMRD